MREQVARLGKLATDLLDLSKLEAGSLELRPEATDLGDLSRRITSEFAPALAKHDSALELRLGGEPIEAVCDPERVAQILRILLDNALTHTPAGTGVAVTALARQRLASGSTSATTARASARDAAGRVFEPFYTSDDAQGSGLGLAIARELAERMDGSLDVDAAPGRRRSRWSCRREGPRWRSPAASRCWRSRAAAARTPAAARTARRARPVRTVERVTTVEVVAPRDARRGRAASTRPRSTPATRPAS